ncbi:MAG: ribonuclease HII, partial [Clostridiaceae bacterium]|nr:ribonuclease HII [Clostridiaceae bacterium]
MNSELVSLGGLPLNIYDNNGCKDNGFTDDSDKKHAFWQIEYEILKQGYKLIAGVDEAGRGPLAGPVCAAAVILPVDYYPEGIDDSKKLSAKKRDKLYDEITSNAIAYKVAVVQNDVIDKINILNATFKAMCEAVEGLSVTPDFVLIDGNCIKGLKIPHQCIVKGDSKSISVAAASILAKVTRDKLMTQLDIV